MLRAHLLRVIGLGRRGRAATAGGPTAVRPGAPPRLFYGWVLVWVLGVTTIVSYGTTQYLFGVLVLPIERELGWDRTTIAGAYSLGLLLSGLLGVPIGRLVDRHGARLPMAVGSGLAGLSLWGLAAAREPWQFYALWAGGIGLANALTLYPVTFTVVTNWFERRRGAALAGLTLLGGLASPIFIPLAGALVPRLGWRGTLLVMGATQLLVALPLHALLLRRRPEDLGLRPDGATDATGGPTPPVGGMGSAEALRQGAFWVLTGALALALLASTAVATHQVAYLIGRGHGAELAATVAGLVGLASLPGRWFLNRLADRVSPQKLLGGSLVAQSGGIALLIQATSVGWLAAYVLVFGGAFGAISPLRAAVMAQRFGRRSYGTIVAAQGVPVAICAAAGPVLAGRLYDALGDYGAALWLCAGSALVAGAAVLLMPTPVEGGP